MDITIFTDPARIGPGIWFKLHIDAVIATSDVLKEAFIVNVNALCDNFKCKKCQGHFRKFIDTHPLRNYWSIFDNSKRDIGFFQWTWKLHNQVNKFLNKYQPSLEEAYNFYAQPDTGACFNCGNNPPTTYPAPEISRAIPSILTQYIETKDIKPKPFCLISPHDSRV